MRLFSTFYKEGFVPKSSKILVAVIVLCSSVTSTTMGYDGSLMNGLNILPSYNEYFQLTTSKTALSTASTWIGNLVVGVLFAKLPDWIGRKPSMLCASLITLVGVVLGTAAQGFGMFVASRIIVGIGAGFSSMAGPIYFAETLPIKWRGIALCLIFDFWYVGGLVASGVTYGTQGMTSTWAWRIPNLLQGFFSLVLLFLLPFIPESPRWLASVNRHDECRKVLAQMYTDGAVEDVKVQMEYQTITDSLNQAIENESPWKVMGDMAKKPTDRKRTLLMLSVAVFSMWSGNNIVSFYLGSMLDQANVTDKTTQLQINIILNSFCLVIALIGTASVDYIGRKRLALWSSGFMTIFLFLVGAFTKLYSSTENTSGVYATVAMIFLFQGSYSFGWTPLSMLYPPEVLSFRMRSIGMGMYTFVVQAAGLVTVYAFPIALDKIGWKTYMINGVWDVFQFVFVLLYWVETKGMSLEEIDAVLDGIPVTVGIEDEKAVQEVVTSKELM
ncbi:uncharacterized protein TRUGW13939_07704 [Talaromyces rugulosus]|uniref:Major facilitator superfamily (MFS) profile domain-containing protein n=1 Tax=Talaromyces rugulosus TaxID=121627 RepID=A0A7H8R2F7_TALRU|nr:uncharacterized protein TRUGW13939_07704 [Talaromyces rugulosus]QKX60559.1 hypothetical protein TRUGW13939_07704 [Talaromyces rugulosus]